MNVLNNSMEMVARRLVQGAIGDANSDWNQLLNVLGQQLRSLPKSNQAECLPSLRQVLSCQQGKDWVGMADALRFQLAPALHKVSQ